MITDTLDIAYNNGITYIRSEIGYSHRKASFWMDRRRMDIKWWLRCRHIDIVMFRRLHRGRLDKWMRLSAWLGLTRRQYATHQLEMRMYSQAFRDLHPHSPCLKSRNTTFAARTTASSV